MPFIKSSELKRMYDADGAAKTGTHLKEAIEKKQLRLEDFSIRDLAENFVMNTGGEVIGPNWVRENCDPMNQGTLLLEAGDGVDSTAFANITGQLVFSKIMQSYQTEAFVLSGLIPSTPTRLNGEKIPGVASVGDKAENIGEGMPYPNFGFGEEYIETPVTTKRGLIVPVTKEAIFFDRTNLVTQRAGEVGQFLGLNKEKRLVDVVIGATNNYKRNGTSFNTYVTTGDRINDQSNPITDWTNLDAAEQLLAGIKDPNTGEPILVSADTILSVPGNRRSVDYVLNATEISRGTPLSPVSNDTRFSNPFRGAYRSVSSQLVYLRLQSELSVSAANAKQYWFLGRFDRAFAYMENWPITVVQAPQNSEAEFTQDTVLRFKASERGAAAVIDPRFVIRNKN